MSQELSIDGKTYISSKRASDLSGYAQDYIGQLARGGIVDARRIGGLWYLSMESLEAYKKNAENFKPEPPTRSDVQEPGTLVFFDGKEYLSAARAAEVTGYAQDYVGQLARSGSVLSRQVGNRWYVEKQHILNHKREKDALLAAVQAESVGLLKRNPAFTEAAEYLSRYSGSEPLLTYKREDGDLIPELGKGADEPGRVRIGPWVEEETGKVPKGSINVIPIRRVGYQPPRYSALPVIERKNPPITSTDPKKSPLILLLSGITATIVIVLSVGYQSTLKQDASYAVNVHMNGTQSVAASAEAVFGYFGNILEPLLTHELVYQRAGDQ